MPSNAGKQEVEMPEPLRAKRPKPARWYAEKYGISIRTVQRIAAMPRAEWEANSAARQKPWEAMGMSRATWYRKGKPLQAPANPESEEVT